jgi:hypothetical protein
MTFISFVHKKRKKDFNIVEGVRESIGKFFRSDNTCIAMNGSIRSLHHVSINIYKSIFFIVKVSKNSFYVYMNFDSFSRLTVLKRKKNIEQYCHGIL